jgi:UDP-N-acetylmuramate dehydrogenase
MKRRVDFSKYSSIKIGCVTDVEVIDEIKELPKEGFIVGGANNLLISCNPPPLFMLSKRFSYIRVEDSLLVIGGATKSGVIHSFCKREGIGGFEYLSKLPGTLGGLVAMNAGMRDSEIFNHLIDIKTHKGYIKKESIEHGYRYADIEGVVYEARFEIEEEYDESLAELFGNMRANQPSNPSAGSAFKNPTGDFAGRLIEEVGLKGYRRGGAAFSEIHANFLVNLSEATFEDAKYLIDLAKERVLERFGVSLEEEIIILDATK